MKPWLLWYMAAIKIIHVMWFHSVVSYGQLNTWSPTDSFSRKVRFEPTLSLPHKAGSTALLDRRISEPVACNMLCGATLREPAVWHSNRCFRSIPHATSTHP